MKVFTGGRGEGNTTVLVEHASKFGYPIICPEYCNKLRIMEISKNLEIDCPTIFTYKEVKSGKMRGCEFDVVCVSDFNTILLMFLRDNNFDGIIDSASASLD